MDTPRLAALEHANMIEANALAGGQVSGALVERAHGVVLIVTGLPLRLFNQVIVEADDAPPRAVADAVAAMRDRHAHFVVNLRAGTDERLLPLMAELGLAPISATPWMPGMALHPLPPAGVAAPEPGHEIRRVTDTLGLADHVRTAAAGFGMPEAWLAAVMTERLLADPSASVYVGYTDGAPVTTGFALRTGRTVGIYNIATVEAARRRGYGAAMTMRLVDDGAAEGCDVAILQASEMGRPIYERLGFRTVVDYLGFAEPASLPPASRPA